LDVSQLELRCPLRKRTGAPHTDLRAALAWRPLQVLSPYVRRRQVILERVANFLSEPSEKQRVRNGGNLRAVALHYARLAAVSPTPTWLLSVDDDEFVLPWRTATPLCRYLASPEAARYKVVRFLWRKVGSSGLAELPTERLTVEAFVNMSTLPLFPIGKPAFYLNHANVTLQTWVDQDNLNVQNGNREGGPYFMHGNNGLLTKRRYGDAAVGLHGRRVPHAMSTIGCSAGRGVWAGYTTGSFDEKLTGTCFHYMRAQKTSIHRNAMWSKSGGRVRRSAASDAEFRDWNEVAEPAMTRWRCAVRVVMGGYAARSEKAVAMDTCRGPFYRPSKIMQDGALQLREPGAGAVTCERLSEVRSIKFNLKNIIALYPRRSAKAAVTAWGSANDTEQAIWVGMACDYELKRREVIERVVAADQSAALSTEEQCQELADVHGVTSGTGITNTTNATVSAIWAALGCRARSNCFLFAT
jgi:hypothetical protein